jgi:hypothetical protein
MDDGGIGTKTYNVVAQILAYFQIVRPNGGRIPHTVIARITGMNHEDVKVIVEAWAGKISNRAEKNSEEEKLEPDLSSMAPGWTPVQTPPREYPNGLIFKPFHIDLSPAQTDQLDMPCAPAQGQGAVGCNHLPASGWSDDIEARLREYRRSHG